MHGSTATPIKTIPNLSDLAQLKDGFMVYDLDKCFAWLQQAGQNLYSKHFRIYPEDKTTIFRLLVYFIGDVQNIEKYNLNPEKGIMLTVPVGCGKTTLMHCFVISVTLSTGIL